MRYLLILLLLAGTVNAQPIIPGRGGSVTPNDIRVFVENALRLPVYDDTTAANLDTGPDSTGLLIFTRSPRNLWVRDFGPKRWVIYGSGVTPPAGNTRAVQFNDAGTMAGSDGLRYPSAGYLDIAYGGLDLLTGGDVGAITRTNVTAKQSIFAIPHYTNTEESVAWAVLQSFLNTNSGTFFGGNASHNALNDIRFMVANSYTQLTGIEWLRAASTGVVFNNSSNNLNWQMKSATDANAFYFVGSTGRLALGGTATPTAVLHLKAGTATASTAPLKFTSGVNLTTAEAGAAEYDGTNLYFSPSTTRKRVPLTNNATPSNGQVPIGNGTDYTAANITSTGSTITVTNGAGTINLDIPSTVISSGTYTPTSSAASGITVGTIEPFTYSRTGNTVTVSGYIATTGATPAMPSTFELTLPIASNLTTEYELTGNISSIVAGSDGWLKGSAANNTAVVQWVGGASAGIQGLRIMFQYQVL